MNLNIIGCGVNACRQITLEGLQLIQSSQRLLYFQLNPEDLDILQRFGSIPPLQCLDDDYHEMALDRDNYNRLQASILQALEEHNSVALLLQGHPMVGVSLTGMLLQCSRDLGFNVNIQAGISSFDSMMIDTERDPLERGTTILDANRLLLFNLEISPILDLYLYHCSSVANSYTDFRNPEKRNRIDLLQDYLLRYYSEAHPCWIIASRRHIDGQSIKIPTTIGALTEQISHITYDTSLYIPGLKPNQINQEILQMMMVR